MTDIDRTKSFNRLSRESSPHLKEKIPMRRVKRANWTEKMKQLKLIFELIRSGAEAIMYLIYALLIIYGLLYSYFSPKLENKLCPITSFSAISEEVRAGVGSSRFSENVVVCLPDAVSAIMESGAE